MKTNTAEVIRLPVQTKLGGYRWTEAQRAKFKATFARKRRERERAEREERRAARNRKAKAPRSVRRVVRESIGRPLAALTGRNTAAPKPSKRQTAAEQRGDAIVYLRAACERTEGLSNAELLAALALRTLDGRIK